MEYRVTCSNCGQVYRINASGGQSVRSVCPNCGHKMLVSLPLVDGTWQPATASDRQSDNGRGGKHGGRHWLLVLLTIIIGVGVGCGIWHVVQQKRIADEQQRVAVRMARKAHLDSLMQLRNQQEAQERETLKAQADQKETIAFLRYFYVDCVFSNTGRRLEYVYNLSENCFQKIQSGSGEEEGEGNAKGVNWEMFGPSSPSINLQRDRDELIRNFKVIHYHDNWYRVRLSAHGLTEYRQVEAFPYRGKVIINDFT